MLGEQLRFLCAAGKLAMLLAGTSCGVQAQAVGCASATLARAATWKPTSQAGAQGFKNPFLLPSFSLQKTTLAGVLAPLKDGLAFP